MAVKIDHMVIKYTKIARPSKNLPKFGFLVRKQTIWQPCTGAGRLEEPGKSGFEIHAICATHSTRGSASPLATFIGLINSARVQWMDSILWLDSKPQASLYLSQVAIRGSEPILQKVPGETRPFHFTKLYFSRLQLKSDRLTSITIFDPPVSVNFDGLKINERLTRTDVQTKESEQRLRWSLPA
jgi:hypothetical protein